MPVFQAEWNRVLIMLKFFWIEYHIFVFEYIIKKMYIRTLRNENFSINECILVS